MFVRDTAQPNGTPTWIALEVPDLSIARTFYEDLFGWEIEEMPQDAAEFLVARQGGRAVAGLALRKRWAAVSPNWMTYLAIDDLDIAIDKVLAGGGAILVPPRPILTAAAQARTAIIRDAGGAMCGLWEAERLIGMEVWETHGAVMWSEQFSMEPQRSRTFYQSLFDNIRFRAPVSWHFGDAAKALGGYTMFSVNGEDVGEYGSHAVASIGLLDPAGPIKAPHWMTCFATADIHATVRTLTALGGTVLLPPYDTMFGPLSIVADNQGAVFMLAVKPQRG